MYTICTAAELRNAHERLDGTMSSSGAPAKGGRRQPQPAGHGISAEDGGDAAAERTPWRCIQLDETDPNRILREFESPFDPYERLKHNPRASPMDTTAHGATTAPPVEAPPPHCAGADSSSKITVTARNHVAAHGGKGEGATTQPRPAPFVISLVLNPNGTTSMAAQPIAAALTTEPTTEDGKKKSNANPNPNPEDEGAHKEETPPSPRDRRWHYRYRINRRGRVVIETNPAAEAVRYWQRVAKTFTPHLHAHTCGASSTSRGTDDADDVVRGGCALVPLRPTPSSAPSMTIGQGNAMDGDSDYLCLMGSGGPSSVVVRQRELLVFHKPLAKTDCASKHNREATTDFGAVDLNCYHIGYPLDMGDIEDIIFCGGGRGDTEEGKGDDGTDGKSQQRGIPARSSGAAVAAITTINCPFHDRSFDVATGDMIRFDYGTKGSNFTALLGRGAGSSDGAASSDAVIIPTTAITPPTSQRIRFSGGGPPRDAVLVRDACRQRIHRVLIGTARTALGMRESGGGGGVTAEEESGRIIVIDSYVFPSIVNTNSAARTPASITDHTCTVTAFASDVFNVSGNTNVKGYRPWRI